MDEARLTLLEKFSEQAIDDMSLYEMEKNCLLIKKRMAGEL